MNIKKFRVLKEYYKGDSIQVIKSPIDYFTFIGAIFDIVMDYYKSKKEDKFSMNQYTIKIIE